MGERWVSFHRREPFLQQRYRSRSAGPVGA